MNLPKNLKTHAGYIAILGRTNVGKSTLLNQILGTKISITADKTETTRHKILGIKTVGNYQTVYVDTPGLHYKTKKNTLSNYMQKTALSSLVATDGVIFVVAGTLWQEADEFVLQTLTKSKCPVILVINKIDLVAPKTKLLKHIQKLNARFKFYATVPLAAIKNINIAALEIEVQKLLPVSPFFFPPEQHTAQNDKFLIAEIIREKLTRFLGQELPYALSVQVDQMKLEKKLLTISAIIYVERRGQKIIIIGKDGDGLKKIGTAARHDLEQIFKQQVFLKLWVKVKSRWTSDTQLLRSFGYT